MIVLIIAAGGGIVLATQLQGERARAARYSMLLATQVRRNARAARYSMLRRSFSVSSRCIGSSFALGAVAIGVGGGGASIAKPIISRHISSSDCSPSVTSTGATRPASLSARWTNGFAIELFHL